MSFGAETRAHKCRETLTTARGRKKKKKTTTKNENKKKPFAGACPMYKYMYIASRSALRDFNAENARARPALTLGVIGFGDLGRGCWYVDGLYSVLLCVCETIFLYRSCAWDERHVKFFQDRYIVKLLFSRH